RRFLLLRARLSRKSESFVRGELFELIAGFSVIGDHAVAEVLYILTGGLGRCELSEVHFHHATLGGFVGEVFVARGNGRWCSGRGCAGRGNRSRSIRRGCTRRAGGSCVGGRSGVRRRCLILLAV